VVSADNAYWTCHPLQSVRVFFKTEGTYAMKKTIRTVMTFILFALMSSGVAEWGAGTDINTRNFPDPIVGFVLNNKGLMAGISLEGSRISKIDP
jgi:lipid-binding SYLF domain-containing protein